MTLHSNILACYLAYLPLWRSVKRNIQMFKLQLKSSPAKDLSGSRLQCSENFLMQNTTFQASCVPKVAFLKPQKIGFSFEQRRMKHRACIFTIYAHF